MGGFGSGRHGGKTCTEDMRRLDVRHIQRAGRLIAGTACGWQWSVNGKVIASIQMTVQADWVWLEYRQRQGGGDWCNMSYSVSLDRTACHMGGERVWWRCPMAGCGRRCAVLFGGGRFACRQCHRLAYRSQREAVDTRAIHKADKLRARLGWTPGILNFPEGKPKGMHWRTFNRLQLEYFAQSESALAVSVARLGLINDRLDKLR